MGVASTPTLVPGLPHLHMQPGEVIRVVLLAASPAWAMITGHAIQNTSGLFPTQLGDIVSYGAGSNWRVASVLPFLLASLTFS